MDQRAGWLSSRKYLQMRQRGCWRWGQYYNWRSAPFRGRHRISRVQRSILSGKGPWMERRTRSTIWDSKEPASCSLHCFLEGLQIQVVWRLRWPYPRGDRWFTSLNTIRSNGTPPWWSASACYFDTRSKRARRTRLTDWSSTAVCCFYVNNSTTRRFY